MKIFEAILLRDNLIEAKTIAEVKKQIDYYAHNEIGVEGISLLPIRDLLPNLPEYSDESLRSKGYILTIADFKKACQEAFKKVESDSILYNSLLKRLHNAYNVFINHYVKGRLANKAALNEMIRHFSAIVKTSYDNRNANIKIMPKELTIQISELLDNEMKKLASAWVNNKVSAKVRKEISNELAKQLLNDWQEDKLELAVKKQLEEEKGRNHTNDSLLSCFLNKKLPINIQNEIQESVIEEIGKDIQALKIKATSPLGAAINYIKQNYLVEGTFNVISTLIGHWQSSQLQPDASHQLEDYILQVIKSKNLVNESSLGQQFSKLAIDIFLGKVQQENTYPEFISKSVEEYTLDLIKNLVSFISPDSQVLAQTREDIYDEAMFELHTLWLNGKLNNTKSDYLQEIVLDELENLHEKVINLIYRNNAANQRIEKLEGYVATLENKIANCLKIINKLQNSSSLPAVPVIVEEEASQNNVNNNSSRNLEFFKK